MSYLTFKQQRLFKIPNYQQHHSMVALSYLHIRLLISHPHPDFLPSRHMGVYSIPPQSEISSRPSPVRHSYAVDSSVYPWDNSANLDGNRNYSKSEHGRSDHVDGYRRTNQTKNTYYQSENKYASLPQSSYSTMPNGNVPKSPKHPVARANSSASNFIQMREKEKDRRYNR